MLGQSPRYHSLGDRALRFCDLAAHVGQHLQAVRGGELEQFAGAEQEVGVARLAEALVADAEGLVDQHAARRQGAGQVRKQRTMQIVGDDDAVERASAEGPGRAILQVGGDDLGVQTLEAGNIAVQGDDGVA